MWKVMGRGIKMRWWLCYTGLHCTFPSHLLNDMVSYSSWLQPADRHQTVTPAQNAHKDPVWRCWLQRSVFHWAHTKLCLHGPHVPAHDIYPCAWTLSRQGTSSASCLGSFWLPAVKCRGGIQEVLVPCFAQIAFLLLLFSIFLFSACFFPFLCWGFLFCLVGTTSNCFEQDM